MRKRSSFTVQLKILETVKENEGISISFLERKIGTNPASLREHCKHLEFFNLLKIKKEAKTQRLFLSDNAFLIVKKINLKI